MRASLLRARLAAWSMVFVLYAVVTSPTHAITYTKYDTVGEWLVQIAVDPQTDQFLFCYTIVSCKNGILLGPTISAGLRFSVLLMKEDWNIPKNAEYEVSIRVDKNRPMRGSASSTDGKWVEVLVSDELELFNQMRKGQSLTVEANQAKFFFGLYGTYRALGRLLDCAEDSIARRGSSNPFGGSSSGQTANPFQ